MSSALHHLNLSPERGSRLPGLAAVREDFSSRPIDEQAALHQAAALGDIDYVFFRRFSDERSSQVAAYVIDNNDDRYDETDLAEIHQRLWLNGSAPLLYVGRQTCVDVLSCAAGPDFWKGNKCVYVPEKIEVTTEISRALEEKQRRFSAFRLSDGTFWDDPANSKFANIDKTAHRSLIAAVVDVDREIEGDKNPILRRLLLLTVLVKYLEDRGVFPDGWFSDFQKNSSSFLDVLKSANPEEVGKLLGKLERKFNGDVFTLPEDSHRKLTTRELRKFAELVEARTIDDQRYLWEQHSFRHIPVEVLSHLYQHFAQRGKGAVFTPPFVASLMLDFALPYRGIRGDERILDPTCGSGVFLVGAFRRLIHAWRSRNSWQQPDVPTLKALLKKSIFGVELQEEAVHLAAFSLALAICDALQPNVIWRDLRFDKLVGSNLFTGDFFQQLDRLDKQAGSEGFSAVLGNPPFLSKLNEEAQAIRTKRSTLATIPDNQMAYSIAEQSMTLLGNGGRLCLIQPSGFLYNEKARLFQKKFLSTHKLDVVLDFTSVRNLYDGADPKTVALLASKETPSTNHLIRHLTFRRTLSVEQRIAFELDHYDKHSIPQDVAERRSWVWRVNLLGGGRLVSLTEKISAMPTLREFIKSHDGWDYGEGFIAAKSGKREPEPWLTNRQCLPTKALTIEGIDEDRIETVKATHFRSAYSPSRYTAPIVLIREHESLPCAYRKSGFLAYRDKIIGISAPLEQREQLRQFYDDFVANREALRAFCFLLGTQALVGKATAILKRDVDVLPWPQAGETWRLSRWEKILCEEIVSVMAEYVRRGQNSRLLRESVKPAGLKEYSDLYVSMLGSVYPNLRALKSGVMDGLAYQAFCFGKSSKLTWPAEWSEQLRKVVYFQHAEALRTVRVLRFYERNTIIIVKPDRLRYWIRSTAIRDADETLVDLQKQGY